MISLRRMALAAVGLAVCAFAGCSSPLESTDVKVRREAVKKITDQAVLTKLAEDGGYTDVRSEAVARITDQAVLAKFATQDSSYLVRMAAVEVLADPAALEKVVLHDGEALVRKAALPHISDQNVLAKVALGDGEAYMRKLAVDALSDQVLLAKIVMESGDENVRLNALDKLTDQSVVARIAVENRDRRMSERAIAMLTDQARLADVAIARDENPEALNSAFVKIADPQQLARVAVKAGSWPVRRAAVNKIEDQALLAKVALESSDGIVQSMTVNKIEEQALLSKISAEAKFPALRDAADRKLAEIRAIAALQGEMASRFVHLDATADERLIRRVALNIYRASSLRADVRDRLCDAVAAWVNFLSDPDVAAEAGGIVNVDIVRDGAGCAYPAGGAGGVKRTIGGEVFLVNIRTGKYCFSHEWKTRFPDSVVDSDFIPAKIVVGELFADRFAEFPQDLLKKIAEKPCETSIRRTAVANLNDPLTLAKLAAEDKEQEIRDAADARIAVLRSSGGR